MKNITAAKTEVSLGYLNTWNIIPTTREIYLHRWQHGDVLEDDCGVDFRMATKFIKNLQFLDKQSDEPILVHMQSRGGDWADGMAIYDAIKACRSRVTILAYAHARSMTSIIFQAADVRVMMPHAIFLIHRGWIGAEDRNEGVYTYIEEAKRDDEEMLNIYIENCMDGKRWKGMTEDSVRAFIIEKMEKKLDWVMSSREAVHHGFADGVLGDEEFDTIRSLV